MTIVISKNRIFIHGDKKNLLQIDFRWQWKLKGYVRKNSGRIYIPFAEFYWFLG